jgi:cysteate synthase
MLENSKAPVTYKSKGLAAHLGLENLYITFNGYYPAIGAHMTTCSFKETEAYSVCARIDENEKRVLVVASAGNTARSAPTTGFRCSCRCLPTTSMPCGSTDRWILA